MRLTSSLAPGGLVHHAVAPLGAALLLLAAALPARAELDVRVSRQRMGRYESVGITARDPLGGLDAKPGPITVTMADSRDRRHSVQLEPSGTPGEWAGRFTPLTTGRYTGTAVLERGEEKEIGLVPLIRVADSRLPGFVRRGPAGGRTFVYSNGSPLFPVGVRMDAAGAAGVVEWRAELARLRAAGVNYLEVPVTWPGELPDSQRLEEMRRVDALLLAAEPAGPRLQLRLEGPGSLTAESAGLYEGQVRQWVRRWSYSPAVAVFYLPGAGPEANADLVAGLVRAVRESDPYGHLVALPGSSGEPRSGADLAVTPANLQQPSYLPALLEMPDPAPENLLPGEATWQFLATGGIGLPLQPYRRDAPNVGDLFQRLTRLSHLASALPLHGRGTAVPGVVPLDSERRSPSLAWRGGGTRSTSGTPPTTATCATSLSGQTAPARWR